MFRAIFLPQADFTVVAAPVQKGECVQRFVVYPSWCNRDYPIILPADNCPLQRRDCSSLSMPLNYRGMGCVGVYN